MERDHILILHIFKQLYCGGAEETTRNKRGNHGDNKVRKMKTIIMTVVA